MEDKVFDLLEKMYIEFNGRFDNVEKDIKGLKEDVTQINFKIDHDISPKINVLFDGHIQHTQQLERIEREVSKHEEFILKRVK